jgi:hypothetical protein
MLDLSFAPSFAAYVLDRPPGEQRVTACQADRPCPSRPSRRTVARCTNLRCGTYLSTGIMIRRRAEKRHVDELLGALDTLSAELDRPALAVRIHVSTHRLSLDRELARGDSPLGSAALALRARQLVSPRTRERDRLGSASRDPRNPFGASGAGKPAARRATGVRPRSGDGFATHTRWHRTCLHSACWCCPAPRDRGSRKCTGGPVARRTRDPRVTTGRGRRTANGPHVHALERPPRGEGDGLPLRPAAPDSRGDCSLSRTDDARARGSPNAAEVTLTCKATTGGRPDCAVRRRLSTHARPPLLRGATSS